MLKSRTNIPKIYLKLRGISYGKNLKMIGYPFFYKFRDGNIAIGDNCTINSSFFSNLIGLYQRTIIIARGGTITIGDNVGISGTTIYSRSKIMVGDYTIIGANCKIIDNDFHGIMPEERNNIQNIKVGNVDIGNNVFIGCNCIILKNTVLGNNCVIGAGSVVHGIFEDNCIIAGNPAKVIGKIK